MYSYKIQMEGLIVNKVSAFYFDFYINHFCGYIKYRSLDKGRNGFIDSKHVE